MGNGSSIKEEIEVYNIREVEEFIESSSPYSDTEYSTKCKQLVERRSMEEEERQKREEEEKQKKEEENRRRIEEEKRRLQGEEKHKREEEERQKREEEGRREREENGKHIKRNPVFWKPYIYDIVNNQQLKDKHNHGVCCVVFAIPDSIEKDDLLCSCSDHSSYNIKECISDDEQIASYVTNIKSASGKVLSLECPLRVYIPHPIITEENRTIAVKVSVDDGKWNRIQTINPYTSKEKQKLQFVGFEINNFTYLQILAVTIITPEKVIVPEEGIVYKCIADKDVSIMFPESTFKEPTQISLTANNISKYGIEFAKANHAILSDVCESTSVLSFDCRTATEKPFNLIVKGLRHQANDDTFYAMYKEKNGQWRFADCEINENMTKMTIPEDVSQLLFIGLTLPKHTQTEKMFELADEIVKHSNEIKIHVVCKQKSYNWNDAHIACVSSERITKYIEELVLQGYAEGPAHSKALCKSEGEITYLNFTGNIDGEPERLKLQSLRHIPDCITCHLFPVNIEDLPKRDKYVRGYLNIQMEDETEKLPLYLEKKVHIQYAYEYRKQFVIGTKATALAKYIALKLNENGDEQDWDRFVHTLEDRIVIRRLNAKIKTTDTQNETQRCVEFMKCWIREKPKTIDKVKLIMNALENSGFDDLKNSAERFIQLFHGILSDTSLIKMAEKIGAEWESLGICLGLTTPEIEQIKMDNASVRLRIYHMLNTWRMSDHVIELGNHIVFKLVEAMNVVGCDSELIDFIVSKSDPILTKVLKEHKLA